MNRDATLRDTTLDLLGVAACIGWAVAGVGVLGAVAGVSIEWLCRRGIDLVFLALPGIALCAFGVALALVAIIARLLVRRMTFSSGRTGTR